MYAEIYAAEAATDPFFSVERFTDRLHRHAAAPRWGCAFGEVDGQPVGYAYGFARTAAYQWGGLLTAVPAEDLAETGTRTFALCEVMVRAPWRGTGIAHTLHEEPLSHRIEERSHLLVEEEHPQVRAQYERWGYHWMGTMQPYADAPRYDSMLRPMR
ncbi:N-acetyltransferase [Kitasatospora sp. MMS16-BH015]|uniref:GNAT family N-acetyltransferase n=1 Tax=Kitasatospora sp. MMS16-BH015 TaxID=2018025 RepID=UPI000CA0B5BF|nr:GNAT family N-acetyltransferase [Kitasatospora sp. MMS16-BH015]AUG76666.1 N-acetyltransferase [Kitasatospora sp. MMS16-BH015]